MKKNLLFTGSNGFLGKNITPLLEEKYKVVTLDIVNADIVTNLSKEIPEIKERIEIVVHAAGKAHVIPNTEKEKQTFFDVNHGGTINLCKALEKNKIIPSSFVFISTVAVYGVEFGENITEEYLLEGNTPYALSKIQAERYLTTWCSKYGVSLSILRPSLLAGPNPPGNLGAMIKGLKSGKYLSVAGGKAKKSILMIQDIANLIPILEGRGGVYNICDNEHPTFLQLEYLISSQLGKNPPFNVPIWFAKICAIIGDLFGKWAPINSLKLKKMTESLTFSNEKAKNELDWQPLSVLENFKIVD